MSSVEISPSEANTLDKAIRMLRDRHYNNYYISKDHKSEKAQANKAMSEYLDQLRYRINKESN